MSFKQKSSPLQQGISSLFSSMGSAVQNINNQVNAPRPMTAAEIAYSNTPAGQAGANNTQIPATNANSFSRPEAASNAIASFAPNSFVTKGREAAAAAANPVTAVTPTVTPTASSATTVKQRGRNWFGAVPTNTVDGGPQSVMQGTHGVGVNRMDSHNTSFYDRANGGQMFNNTNDNAIANPSSMFSPLPQLKKEQMEYNKISPKAFSDSGTIEKMMGKAMPNSPFMQMVDPLTGLAMDPTMNQDPNAPVAPPMGVQTPITPMYDLNNQ
jgi:hypothetical protein